MVRVTLWLWCLASACSDPTDGSDSPAPTTGALELTISTSGHDLDPNGYTLSVDGGAPTTLPANGMVTQDEMQVGTHALSLGGMDENCALQEQVPFPFSIVAGGQTKVALHVTCDFANTLAFTQGGKVYITPADPGAVPRQIAAGYFHVSWSPDGSTLALVEPRTVALADADGGNVRVLDRLQGEFLSFTFSRAFWSPDGTSILVNLGSAHTHSLVYLSTSQPNDSLSPWHLEYSPQCQPVREMRAPTPSWSPDGHHLVVNGLRDSLGVGRVPTICMYSAAGELERPVARGDWPAWSPDGSRIAYTSSLPSDSSIHTIAPDGTDDRDLSPSSAGPPELVPTWSPDSGELSFLVHSPGETDPLIYELWVVDALGGNRRRLVPQVKSAGAWSRDGSRLAFQMPTGQLAVIESDGTGLTPVSPAGESVYSWSWRP